MKHYLSAACKKTLWITLLLMGLLFLYGMPLYADEEKTTADLSVAALTKYVWRGQELSRDSIVLQPSATIGYKGFSVNFWGNTDTKPYLGSDDNNSLHWTKRTLPWDTAGLSVR